MIPCAPCAMPYPISNDMFREQRRRLGASLTAKSGPHAVALIQGGCEIPINYTDCNYEFRQDSYFYYLFGFEMPECYGAVFSDGTGCIFIPSLDPSYATWYGPLPTVADVIAATNVENAAFEKDIVAVFSEKHVSTIHVLKGINSDSKLPVLTPSLDSFKFTAMEVVTNWLYTTLSNQRVFKTATEIELLKYINKVSSTAHVKAMTMCKPGMSEHHLEGIFRDYCFSTGGCRRVSYGCICATGHRGAYLHYPHNNQEMKDGMMALMDMGGEYHCYSSDITCCYPVNAKFSAEQRWVYQAVLDANLAVQKAMQPGVAWVDMHKLALRVMSKHLLEHGILKGGSVEEIEKLELMYVFQPHGLGHLLGLDTHDVGGYPEGGNERPKEQLCCRLRTARNLEKDMFITVEPGLYFNQYLFKESFADPIKSKYFNRELLETPAYWNFGGVRIEDDIIVTEDGCVNLTVVPRTVEDIEAVMARKIHWDSAPTVHHNKK